MGRFNYGSKPFSAVQPVWIIVTYDGEGGWDAMNAAWAGMAGRNKIMACLTSTHKTVKNFLKTNAFTISMGDANHVMECDYVGIVSANDTPDKMTKTGFTVTKSELVEAPIINELPICLECKVESYNEDTGLLVGEILNVSVSESVMTDGKVDMNKVSPIAFDPFNNIYHVLGDMVGTAWGSGKKLV